VVLALRDASQAFCARSSTAAEELEKWKNNGIRRAIAAAKHAMEASDDDGEL
jgi:hypothetical protein